MSTVPPARDDSSPPSRLALWLPVMVSGTAMTLWIGILVWIAVRD